MRNMIHISKVSINMTWQYIATVGYFYFCLTATVIFSVNTFAAENDCSISANSENSQKNQTVADSSLEAFELGLEKLSASYQQIHSMKSPTTSLVTRNFYSSLKTFYELHKDRLKNPNELFRLVLRDTPPEKPEDQSAPAEAKKQKIINRLAGFFPEDAKILPSKKKVIWQSPSKNWVVFLDKKDEQGLQKNMIQYKDGEAFSAPDRIDVSTLQEWNGQLIEFIKKGFRIFFQDKSKVNFYYISDPIFLESSSFTELRDSRVIEYKVSNGKLINSQIYKLESGLGLPTIKPLNDDTVILVSGLRTFQQAFIEYNKITGFKLRDDIEDILSSPAGFTSIVYDNKVLETHYKENNKNKKIHLNIDEFSADSYVYVVDENNVLITFTNDNNNSRRPSSTDWYQKNKSGEFKFKKDLPYLRGLEKIDGHLLGISEDYNWYNIDVHRNPPFISLEVVGMLKFHPPFIFQSTFSELKIYKANKDYTKIQLISEESEGTGINPNHILLIKDRYILNYSSRSLLEFIDLSSDNPKSFSLPTPDNASFSIFKEVSNTDGQLYIGVSTGFKNGSFLIVDTSGPKVVLHRVFLDQEFGTGFYSYFNFNEPILTEEGIKIGEDIIIKFLRLHNMF
ncbi:MAG: hypothetical protein VX642_11360 [Bdellovibrionota bacterium]|nr:hypothetical protein [Bdellovibrionota bacterium]